MSRIDASSMELIDTVVAINRVSKTVKGGRIMKFAALVVVGDKNGTVGLGIGKSGEVTDAIRKGIADAKKNLIKVSLRNNNSPRGSRYIRRRKSTYETCRCRYRSYRGRTCPFGNRGSRHQGHKNQVLKVQQSLQRSKSQPLTDLPASSLPRKWQLREAKTVKELF